MAIQVLYSLFLPLSLSCKYLTVATITMLIHNSIFMLKLFSLTGLLIFPCFYHLKINYSFVKTVHSSLVFEACAYLSAFISTSLFSPQILYLLTQ